MTSPLRRAATAITVTAAVAAAGVAAAGAAHAVYPPAPSNATSQSATIIAAGGSVSFTFGDANSPSRFMPGSTVNISCTGPAAPMETVTTADSAGVANATFTFTTPGVWTCAATGSAINGTPLTLTAKPVTVTGGSAVVTPAGQAAAPAAAQATPAAAAATGSLAQTGGNNTLTIAAVGAGLLLAGVGAVVVARRREQNG